MHLRAKNKHLVLEVFKKELKDEKVTEFFGAAPKKPENIAYTILDMAADCTVDVAVGEIVIIDGNMVQENIFHDQVFLTCKENFIIGVLKV